MKILKRHLGSEHGLTVAEYRKRWNLPADHPMVAPDYTEKRKMLALEIGLGRKPKATTASASDPAKPAKVIRPRKKLGVAFSEV